MVGLDYSVSSRGVGSHSNGGPLNLLERFVVDTVIESVLAMERDYTEQLFYNLGLQFVLQLAAAEFAQQLNRLD